jgi:hypothetical protein
VRQQQGGYLIAERLAATGREDGEAVALAQCRRDGAALGATEAGVAPHCFHYAFSIL